MGSARRPQLPSSDETECGGGEVDVAHQLVLANGVGAQHRDPPLPMAQNGDNPADAALAVLLDPELLAMVLQWLPRDRSTLRCGLTCSTWLHAVLSQSLWSSVRLTFKDPSDLGQARFLGTVAEGVQRLEIVDATHAGEATAAAQSDAEQRSRLACLRDAVSRCLSIPMPHLTELRCFGLVPSCGIGLRHLTADLVLRCFCSCQLRRLPTLNPASGMQPYWELRQSGRAVRLPEGE